MTHPFVAAAEAELNAQLCNDPNSSVVADITEDFISALRQYPTASDAEARPKFVMSIPKPLGKLPMLPERNYRFAGDMDLATADPIPSGIPITFTYTKGEVVCPDAFHLDYINPVHLPTLSPDSTVTQVTGVVCLRVQDWERLNTIGIFTTQHPIQLIRQLLNGPHRPWLKGCLDFYTIGATAEEHRQLGKEGFSPTSHLNVGYHLEWYHDYPNGKLTYAHVPSHTAVATLTNGKWEVSPAGYMTLLLTLEVEDKVYTQPVYDLARFFKYPVHRGTKITVVIKGPHLVSLRNVVEEGEGPRISGLWKCPSCKHPTMYEGRDDHVTHLTCRSKECKDRFPTRFLDGVMMGVMKHPMDRLLNWMHWDDLPYEYYLNHLNLEEGFTPVNLLRALALPGVTHSVAQDWGMQIQSGADLLLSLKSGSMELYEKYKVPWYSVTALLTFLKDHLPAIAEVIDKATVIPNTEPLPKVGIMQSAQRGRAALVEGFLHHGIILTEDVTMGLGVVIKGASSLSLPIVPKLEAEGCVIINLDDYHDLTTLVNEVKRYGN